MYRNALAGLLLASSVAFAGSKGQAPAAPAAAPTASKAQSPAAPSKSQASGAVTVTTTNTVTRTFVPVQKRNRLKFLQIGFNRSVNTCTDCQNCPNCK